MKLRGRRANRQGLGARVRVYLADGRTLDNHATTAVGYGSASEPLVRFGLGASDRVKKLEVHWPGGGVQELGDLAADRVLEVAEPER